jgi:hypothetical protein
VADVTNPNVPGTLADGFWQEPIDIIPVGELRHAEAVRHVVCPFVHAVALLKSSIQ